MQDNQYTITIMFTLETVDGGAKVTGNLEVTGDFVTADTDNLSEGFRRILITQMQE